MITSSVFEFFAIATLLCLNPQESRSHEAAAPVKVTYAVVMGQNEPISAEVSCVPDVACDLIDHADPAVHLAITVYSGLKGDGELRIYCWSPCSFIRSRSRIDFSGRRVTADIFLGEPDFGIAVPLVVRQRPIIGEVLVSF
ncbi:MULTISPECIES: hypothetical protein [unclassified Rhizobium]|jgi:hypothetical protein|uniref:hypothetical protein n=1 Tax=unclassified Rhizobium TaxID=2613769 RepID=UPI001A9839A4|nr:MULTISPECIES: hypothetical protein [unclassified Rhizobium]MBX5190695.1 hypothetical protein [Rhizobium sp. NZLR3b]MBX5202921.1 hypothetical protein [Rhizobium sp. NZLR1]QSZ19313.1 hypothetical protein J3O30_13155 [Rhizobium sp. NZLR1]